MDTCEFCDKSDETVHIDYDPFAREVNGNETKGPICDQCYSDRAQEI